jgi:hypothetical protein
MNQPIFVLNPVGEVWSVSRSLAPRPSDLAGLRVAFIDNTKPNSDRFMAALADGICERTPLAEVILRTRPYGLAVDPMLDEIAQRCHFAVTGVGD